MTWRAPPTGTERQDPRVSGQEAYLGRWVRNCTLCTHPVAARARQQRGASATTEFSVKLGALPRVAVKRLYLFVFHAFVLHARRPNAVASARSATARARASLPGCDRPGSTSKARQGESDHAIAETAPQRRQRRVGAESTTGLRSQQLGHTAYLPSSEVGAASSGLRRTSDHMGGRSGRICRKARGTRNRRLLTSSTVSPPFSSTTRYHAPRRSGQSIPARTRAQYCTCGMRTPRGGRRRNRVAQSWRLPGDRHCDIRHTEVSSPADEGGGGRGSRPRGRAGKLGAHGRRACSVSPTGPSA